jgi:peptidoglycan/LPS O-acetylase OafA/YrhL
VVMGVYLVVDQFNLDVPYRDVLFQWPSVLILIGLILTWQGFSNKEEARFFSGAVSLGLGIFFHGVHTFNVWEYNWPYITLIVAFAFLLKYAVNRRDGMAPGFILLLISIIAMFFDTMTSWLDTLYEGVSTLLPFMLIVLGIYLLFFRKK